MVQVFSSRFLALSTLQESIKVPYCTVPHVLYQVPIGVLARLGGVGPGLAPEIEHVHPTFGL